MKICIPLASLIFIFSPLLLADETKPVQQAIDTVAETHQKNIHSQQKINQLDDQARQLLEQYRLISRRTETLEIYNQQLRRLLTSQLAEMESLAQQIQNIEVTQQEITPFIAVPVDLSMLGTGAYPPKAM